MYFFHGLGALQPKARDGVGFPILFNIILIIGQNWLLLRRRECYIMLRSVALRLPLWVNKGRLRLNGEFLKNFGLFVLSYFFNAAALRPLYQSRLLNIFCLFSGQQRND